MAQDDAGPLLMIKGGGGADLPLYLVSFDKQGKCTSPRTRAALLADAASGHFTDLHIYCHGWNNVFDEAVRHYAEFFTEYAALRGAAGLDAQRYKPLVVGLIWPSTALLAPGEESPRLASFDGAPAKQAPDAAAAPDVAALADDLAPADAKRLAALATRQGALEGDDAAALAQLLAPLLGRHADGDSEGAVPADEPAMLLTRWGKDAPASSAPAGAPGRLPLEGEAANVEVEAGGLLRFLDPREIIRKATVFLMKDRAGTVGAAGVAELVRDVAAIKNLRVHLTGHSYGAKVMLSALARLPESRQVTSVLLLQAAVSARCFAPAIPERSGKPGGYHEVLGKSVLPPFVTFSPHDQALSRFYPLALRRGRDIGDIEAGAPSSLFAALGAVGPQGMAPGELELTPLLDQPGFYTPAAKGVRIRALDGARAIHDHGDVRNRFTEWALANLVRAGAAAGANA
jgi:pimeloyl-ACP methyl ester carboxylesterase